MNAQLLQKLKKRRQMTGDEDKKEVKKQKQKIQITHDSNRDNVKKNLQNLFGGGGKKEEVKPEKKEQIVGDKKGFNQARKKLEMQLAGNKTQTSNQLPTTGGLNLPPPLTGINLPPPPSGLNLPSLPLPPPPPMIGLDLPPPPLNALDLPPPPLSTLNLPPPPPLSNLGGGLNLPPPSLPKTGGGLNLPPPPPVSNSGGLNLPPPPPLSNLGGLNLPPPPPPPSLPNLLDLPLPPPPISTSLNNSNQPPNISNFNPILPPPPSLDNSKSPINTTIKFQYSTHDHQKPTNTIPPKTDQIEQQHQTQRKQMNPLIVNTFTTIMGNDLKVKQQQKQPRQRKKIFNTQKKKVSFTKQLFQKDIAAYFKNNLFSNTNISSISEQKMVKRKHQFNYPSFEQGKRQKDQRVVLYFNGDADVVSTFLPFSENQINKQVVQQHRKNLKNFKAKLSVQQTKSEINIKYNWIADPAKIMPIKLAFDLIPSNMHFQQIDFNQIKKMREKITKIIKKFERQQNYHECAKYNQISVRLMKMSQQFYKQDLQTKRKLRQQIESIIEQIKKI